MGGLAAGKGEGGGAYSMFKNVRAVDPHSFVVDPDPAVFLNADPDLDPGGEMNADPCGSGSSLTNL